MKKIVLVCALSAIVSFSASARSGAPDNDRRIVWFDKNDITKGGVFTFVQKNSSDKREMGIAIPAGSEEEIMKYIKALQAEYPLSKYIAP